MREISTERIVLGEHILIDGVEYVVEGYDDCSECAFNNSKKCDSLPCCTGGSFSFTKVQKESKYRPYKDTDEMIDDYKKRFNVTHVPAISMPLIWVKYMEVCSLITDIKPEMVVVNGDVQSMTDLSVWYTYLDGSPCGKVEE